LVLLLQIEPYKPNREAGDEVVEKYPRSPLGESFPIQPVIEKQNHTVKNFGTVGYILPGSELLRGMADAVGAWDEDYDREQRSPRPGKPAHTVSDVLDYSAVEKAVSRT
jgi:hypothetical protein